MQDSRPIQLGQMLPRNRSLQAVDSRGQPRTCKDQIVENFQYRRLLNPIGPFKICSSWTLFEIFNKPGTVTRPVLSHLVRPRTSVFQLTAGLGLVVYGLLLTGLPLPIPSHSGPKSTERYPCEDSACGCSDAEQCWSQCCCNTLRERLAWARRHRVRPAESALLAATRQGYDISHWEYGEARDSTRIALVAEPADDMDCCSMGGDRRASVNCCQMQATGGECPPKDCDAKETIDRRTHVQDRRSKIVMMQALACRGIFHTWLTIASNIPPRAVRAPRDLWVVETVAQDSYRALARFDPPDPPPPKERFGAPVVLSWS